MTPIDTQVSKEEQSERHRAREREREKERKVKDKREYTERKLNDKKR